jgi:hypothetical protein
MVKGRFSWLSAVLLCCAAVHAHAQQQPQETPAVAQETVAPSEAEEAEDTAPASTPGQDADSDGMTRILIIGDALAGGLGNGIMRMAETDSSIVVVNRFNEVSGLARVELFDLSSALSKIVAANPADAVVVHVGVNDRQDIRGVGGRLKFRSPEWEAAYTSNVDRLVNAVKAANARLYWVSLPPMGDQRFDEDMQYIAAIHRARVTALGENYVDVRSSFLGADGKYAERGPDDTGANRKIRARDGIAFMRVGNNRFGQLVLAALMKVEKAVPTSPTALTPQTQTPTTPTGLFIGPPAPPVAQSTPALTVAATPAPEFGQLGLDGQPITFRPEIALAPVPQLPSAPKPEVPLVVEKGPIAKPGSQAAKLFKEGAPLTAPSGRFDDYAEPPLPAQ